MTQYQIALLGSDNAFEPMKTLVETLKNRSAELGLGSECICFLDESTVKERDRKAPTVAAYLGLEQNPVATLGLHDLLDSSVMIVPVVKNLSDFSRFVPTKLHPFNGAEIQDENLSNVAAALLEGLNLLRKSRRLFISYKRSETRGIAIQLYELLDKSGFDVFLDSHSIRPGEPFQEVLWHRLADADVMVLLDSPGFFHSRWTEEEFTRANQSSIQILQLLWPHSMQELGAAFNSPFSLTDSDFTNTGCQLGPDARLSDNCLNQIAHQVESIRARALAARQSRLVEEFCREAKSFGLSPILQPNKVVSFKTLKGREILIIPTIGIPNASRYHDLELELSDPKYNEIVLLYDERGIQGKWLTHIDWLDRHPTTVKSLKIANAKRWLGELD